MLLAAIFLFHKNYDRILGRDDEPAAAETRMMDRIFKEIDLRELDRLLAEPDSSRAATTDSLLPPEATE